MDYTQEVRAVLAYVEEHLYEEFSLEELARVGTVRFWDNHTTVSRAKLFGETSQALDLC